MASLSKRERVLAALSGAEVDRVPISFWGHFPSDPHRGEDLAATTVRNQLEYDWDFVKMMPSGMFFPEALGCKLTGPVGPGAFNFLTESTIKRPEDFASIPVLDPRKGWLAEHIKSIELTRAALGPDVPILETLFSPLTQLHKLSTEVSFEDSIREHRASFEAGLRAITEGTELFAEACLEAGADGFFFALQEANEAGLPQEEFLTFGKPYDFEILRHVAAGSAFNMLHVCRDAIYADLVADYPVQAINWETGGKNPSLAEAREIWPYSLVGGLDRNGVVVDGTPEEVAAEVRAAIAEAGARRYVVGAGCTLPVARKAENLRAARQAVEAR